MGTRPPGTPLNLQNTINNIANVSSTLAGQVNAYTQGGGTYSYIAGAHSYYEVKSLVNNISAPGSIKINAYDAAAYADSVQTSYLHALTSIIIHEMGHAHYATADLSNYTGDPQKMIAWCIKREGEAAAFSFKVTQDLVADGGYMPVAGPPSMPDLYATMSSAVQGLNPDSIAYTNALINAASAKYSADPKYMAYCTDWAYGKKGLPPQFLPPAEQPPGGGGGGGSGGGSGGAGSMLIPGGYWQKVPEIPEHDSSLISLPPAETEAFGMTGIFDPSDIQYLEAIPPEPHDEQISEYRDSPQIALVGVQGIELLAAL